MKKKLKISVLTPTYNRAELLKKLYESLNNNSKYDVEIEWLIMDDGSTDSTREYVKQFKEKTKIEIKYFYQENQGKMVAINKLVGQATGDLIIDCDSDDYFTDDAFNIIKQSYENNKKPDSEQDRDDVYALCFLKLNQNGTNMGKNFKNKETTMFDLYFKEGEDGEKSIVFYSKIRKQYKHELENNERFVTEARMYHKMDKKYKIICINKPIMICEYQEGGYTRNIEKQFKQNPVGYYKYFQEILQNDMKGVIFKKRLYVIKHYILFSYLTKQYNIKFIKNLQNKVLFCILLLPGIIKSRFFLNKNMTKNPIDKKNQQR